MLLIPLWYAVILAVIFGSCLGSFYNVIIYRMPRGLSLWKPPSFCPRCKKRIPIYYNLPVIGWLWLRGKSACCKEPISIQYPLVEALCGVLGGAAFLLANYPWDWGGEVAWPQSLALFWLLLAAVPVIAVDCEFHLIPDSMSIGGIVVGILLSFFPGGITPLWSVLGAVFAGGGLFLFAFVMSKLLKKEAMGFGDIKLVAGYGALVGWLGAVEIIVLASVLGLLVMVPLRLWQKRTKHPEDGPGQIPFGPFLAIAAPVICKWGGPLLSAYLSVFLS